MKHWIQTMMSFPFGGGDGIQTMSGFAISLLMTLLLSGCMMLVYRLCHDSLTYNRKFNITLIMLAFASMLLLSIIQNNPLFSLGALGALSICRIRTNTRDPRDLGFVFWALSIGLSSALGAYVAGLAGTAALSVVMLLMEKTAGERSALTIVIRGSRAKLQDVQTLVLGTKGSTVQSENLFPDTFELVYELRGSAKQESGRLMTLLGEMEGVHGVNVLAPKTKVE